MEPAYDVVHGQTDGDFVLVVGWDGGKRIFARIELDRLLDALRSRDPIHGAKANLLVMANLPKVAAVMTAKYRSGQFVQTPPGTDNYLIDITLADLDAMSLDASVLSMSFGIADQAGRF